ncbi:MAG: hypothetical protein H6624_00775 [Bdellovibrionaceae bacterium]|nr:hypothetical protein [Bdellovibrionales bacterium]MCB9082842.1 hypothetical protein [Pseudobdellovibrionaceae bacterium]
MAVKFLRPLFLFAFFASSFSALAGQFVILKSNDLNIYKSTIQAFKEDMVGHQVVEIDLAGKKSSAEMAVEDLDKNPPTAVFALGTLAAKTFLALKNKDIPCLYTFVLRIDEIQKDFSGRKIRGISIEVPAKTLEQQVRMILPSVKTIKSFASSSSTMGNVADKDTVTVNSGKEMIKKLEDSKAQGEAAYWLHPDPALMANVDFKSVAEASRKSRVPLIVFSEAFVRAGGFISVSLNYETLGHQAAAILSAALETNDWSQQLDTPIGTSLVVNKNLAKEFGYQISDRIYRLMVDVVVD